MGGGSALILSQQTGCMLRGGEGGGVSLDTFTGKGCKVEEGGKGGAGGGVHADARLPLSY